VQEPFLFQIFHLPVWFSYKFKDAVLQYKVALSIIHGDIVWLNGPFPCSTCNNLSIFQYGGLKDTLEEGEQVEADDGYAALGPEFVKTCSSPFHPKEYKAVQNKVCARQETIYKQFKQWGVICEVFCHKIMKHHMWFQAVAVLTQLSIENEELLFQIRGYR
jgi:hypothetical protein